MEASTVYCGLISNIEKSGLNYKIIKTPFSASISIKSSFVKYFKAPGHSEISVTSETEKKPNTVKIAHEENVKLRELLKQEKIKVKSLEKEVEEFREEMLKLKREKKASKEDLKSLETDLDIAKEDLLQMDKAKSDLENQFQVKSEVLIANDNECSKLKEENTSLMMQHQECILEIQTLKEEHLNEKKIREYNCSHCGVKFESLVKLSQHVRSAHCKDQVSQTRRMNVDKESVFHKYPCHYCSRIITSVHDLEEHKPICYTIEDFAPYPCDVCGAQCPEEASLGVHRMTYHELGTFSEHLGVELFWCDTCPITFRNKTQLQDHFIDCHEEHFE